MTAQRLRDAAKVLRELAEGATPGTWEAYRRYDLDRSGDIVGVCDTSGEEYSRDIIEDPSLLPGNAAYIATMSPPVALALADWLSDAANSLDYEAAETDAALAVLLAAYDPAFRVAEAILGTDS
jgi:hypothetical protein